MTPRQLVLAGAILLGIVAAILLNTPVSAVTSGDRDVSCGSVWSPDTRQAEQDAFVARMDNAFAGRAGASTSYDGLKQVCSDARDARGTWGYVLAGLCVAGLIGAGVRRSAPTGQQTA